jgi:hypothetical protein
VVGVLLVVEVPHTHLTEVTRVILVKGNSVHVLATSVTATGSVLAVLADTAITAVHATALLPVLLLCGRLHRNRHAKVSMQNVPIDTKPNHKTAK